MTSRRLTLVSVLVLLGSLWCVAALAQSKRPTLLVTHLPDPCPVNRPRGEYRAPYPNVWYYRTEVKNNTAVPLRIVKFTPWALMNGKWKEQDNVLHHPLGSKEFTAWYTEGDEVTDGWIAPGKVAACDPNWTWNREPIEQTAKWVFTATDKQGATYTAEAIVHLLPKK